MESKFIPTLQAGNGYTYLKLKGILDEDNLLANLLSQIQGRLLMIDMAEIERINSCGVRDWVNWLNQIQALGIAVILLRCSPAVVSQANMVTNFAADAFIESFYAPYVHPDTGEEQSVLLFTEEVRQNLPVRAPKIFNEQGEELEFDEFEESYFAFISDPRILNYRISPDVQAVIQYYLPESAARRPVVGARQQTSAQAPQVGNAGYVAAQPHSMTSSQLGNAPSPVSQMMRSQLGNAPGSAPIGMMPQRNAYGAAAQPAGAAQGIRPPAAAAQGYAGQTFGRQTFGQTAQAQTPASSYADAGYDDAATAAFAAPQNMPKPAQSLLRHEQPPLPSNDGAQRIAPMPQPLQPTAPISNRDFAQDPPNPMSGAAPRPAPAPVSPLAQQSMARQSLTVPAQSSPDSGAVQIPPQNLPMSGEGFALRSDGGLLGHKRLVLIIAGVILLLLIAVLIIVLVKN